MRESIGGRIIKILLTNDDGISAVGIRKLAAALVSKGHEIAVSAPEHNQSAVGHSLTLRRLLYVERVSLPGFEHIPAYSVSETPVDCVRFALEKFSFSPDIIISGINCAPNLGTDTIYSGTVAAALEGSMIGYPAIAVSKDTFTDDYMEDAAIYFSEFLPILIRDTSSFPGMLSVNIPSKPRQQYRGVRVGKLALQNYDLRYSEEIDMEGHIAYRVTSQKLTKCNDDDETDEKYMRDSYVVVTPLTFDMTDFNRLSAIKNSIEREY